MLAIFRNESKETIMPGQNVQVHYVHSDILTQSDCPSPMPTFMDKMLRCDI